MRVFVDGYEVFGSYLPFDLNPRSEATMGEHGGCSEVRTRWKVKRQRRAKLTGRLSPPGLQRDVINYESGM